MNPSDERAQAGTLRFLIPSLIGIAMFLTPIPTESGPNILIGILADAIGNSLGTALPAIVVGAVVLSAVASLIVSVARPAWATREGSLGAVFSVGPFALFLRIAGATLAVMVLFQVGPEWVISDATGGTILRDLMTVIFALFLLASIFLPFLTDFGLMELIGTAVRPVSRPVFLLPGRAAVDGVASWFGSGVLGIIITNLQHEEGYYTKREAAVIATNFSVVSVAFAAVIINFVDLGSYFLQFYGAVVLSGIVAAIIMPRIPPLSRKPDTYTVLGPRAEEEVPEGRSTLSWGMTLARRRAAEIPPPSAMARQSLNITADIWFGLEPLVMVIGTVALALQTYTPIFDWLSYPVVPFLELLRLPEAAAAAPAMLVGFMDQFLPAILGQAIESDVTRFVVACASVTQLIYMSEVGVLLLKSNLSLRLWDLFAIFLLRTLITIPICAAIAHLVF